MIQRRLETWFVRLGFFATVIIAMLGAAARVDAQTVSARASTNRVLTGEPVYVDISIINPEDNVSAPTAQQTSDFDIRLVNQEPMRNTSITIIQGTTEQKVELTYRFECRPKKTGQLEIPAFSVNVGGKVQQTRPMTIQVTKGPTGPFVYAEVLAPNGPVYVGQTVDLTLEVWIRQYTQSTYTLEANAMWTFFLEDLNRTSLGVFAEAVQGQIKYRPAKRADEDGVVQDFYVFLLPVSAPLTKSGMLDVGAVEILYGYPLNVSRNVFGQMHRNRTMDLRVIPTLPQTLVRSLPEQGRPPDFNGAVGRYKLRVSAKPTTVPLGDPITLTLFISSEQEDDLERLGAPRLDRVTELTRDFEVPADAPAGSVEGRMKVFTLTIRALREDVTKIAPIPLSFFDPAKGQFATIHSEPIPIRVTPAQRIDAPPIMPTGETPVATPLEESAGGLFANYEDPALVLSDQGATAGPLTWSVLGVMPLLYGVTWFVQRRGERLRNDERLRRRTHATRNATRLLQNGNSGDPAGAATHALLGFIADRCGIPAGGMTRPDAVAVLTAHKVPANTINEIDAFLTSLELAKYGGGAGASPEQILATARRLIDELERHGLK